MLSRLEAGLLSTPATLMVVGTVEKPRVPPVSLTPTSGVALPMVKVACLPALALSVSPAKKAKTV